MEWWKYYWKKPFKSNKFIKLWHLLIIVSYDLVFWEKKTLYRKLLAPLQRGTYFFNYQLLWIFSLISFQFLENIAQNSKIKYTRYNLCKIFADLLDLLDFLYCNTHNNSLLLLLGMLKKNFLLNNSKMCLNASQSIDIRTNVSSAIHM